MNFSTLTLNERERLAYAEGYTETAALLAEMADLEQERDKLQDRLDEVEFDFGEIETKYHALIDERDELEDEMHKVRENRDELQAELDNVSDECDAAQSGLDEIGCKLHDTRAELELTNDKAKTYRAALMALEADSLPHIRQFIREVLA
jgi:chromosome segregation ATPase